MDDSARHYLVVDHFFSGARALRAAFDKRMNGKSDPLDPSRFVWEEWHVDGQFSQHRAPARTIFPAESMAAFEARLLAWARGALGLSVLGSPPWVSYVTDSGFQGLHRDTPNGEFAFSFSLVRTPLRFRGGETMLARPELLDYWRRGGHRADTAHTPMFDMIPPRFNRLVAFDSRVPHGVRMVEGPREPRDGRIAIQGWMRPAGCVVENGQHEEATAAANAALRACKRADLRGAEGLFTARVRVGADGRAREVEPLVDTMVATTLDAAQPAKAARAIEHAFARARFPARAARVVVPALVADGAARVPA